MHFSLQRMLPSHVKLLKMKILDSWQRHCLPLPTQLQFEFPKTWICSVVLQTSPFHEHFPMVFMEQDVQSCWSITHTARLCLLSAKTKISLLSCVSCCYLQAHKLVPLRWRWMGGSLDVQSPPLAGKTLSFLCLGSSHFSFIQQQLPPGLSQLSSSVTVTPDGSSGLWIQLWVKMLANVSLHPSFFEDSFPWYFPTAPSVPTRAIKMKLHQGSTWCSYLVC